MLILQFNIYFIALIYTLHTDTGGHFFALFPFASISSRYIKQQTTKFFPFYYFSTFQTFFFAFHLGFSSPFLFILFPTQHFCWLTDSEEPPPTPQIAVDTSENFYISVIPECQEKKRFISLAMFDSRCTQAAPYLAPGFSVFEMLPSCPVFYRIISLHHEDITIISLYDQSYHRTIGPEAEQTVSPLLIWCGEAAQVAAPLTITGERFRFGGVGREFIKRFKFMLMSHQN